MEGARGTIGSHRHDRGDAADFDLIDEKGNLVPHSDPRALEFVEHAARAGVKGGGAEQNYMGPVRMHLDVVGAERGGGAGIYRGSAAFREAYARGARARMTPEQVAAELDRLQRRTQVASLPTVGGAAPSTPSDRLAQQDADRLALRRLREEREKLDAEATPPGMGSFTLAARRQRLAGRGPFRTPTEDVDRSMLDQTQGRAFFHRVRGTGNIDVTVKKGQESVRQKGPFRKVPWHRHKQMEEASHGPEASSSFTGGSAVSHDPSLDS
jgi:hypothetical protein